MKSMSSKLTPVRLRFILIAVMILIVSLSYAGFFVTQQKMRAFANDVSQTVARASASEDNLSRLTTLESELVRLRSINQRASSIAAESKSYQYQNQIIADLNDYARESGVTISSFNFDTTAASAGSGTPAPVAGGLKTTVVNVSLQAPISYTNLLTFMKLVEQNLTKMQIASVSLTRGGESNSAVSTEALNIEVYIK